MPQSVIDRDFNNFYQHENSNIHRAAHELFRAARATDAYEAARDKVARFIGAGSSSEIIFVQVAPLPRPSTWWPTLQPAEHWRGR